jgi:putative acetyltransferase
MIEVRHVAAGDVERVVALVAATLAEFGLEFGRGAVTDAELYALPASYADRGGAFWVGVDRSPQAGACGDDVLLGTCGVFPVADATYELRKMYLSPEARGRGLGERMLDVAVEWVKQRRGKRIVLDTVETMTRAIAFYEKHGFIRDDAQIRGSRCTRGYAREL